jgi:hypothetical protein
MDPTIAASSFFIGFSVVVLGSFTAFFMAFLWHTEAQAPQTSTVELSPGNYLRQSKLQLAAIRELNNGFRRKLAASH